MHFLDLMTQSTLLDPHVWAHPDTWSAAIDNTAARRTSSSRRGGGFWIFAAVCCIGVIALVLGIVYLMTNRRR